MKKTPFDYNTVKISAVYEEGNYKNEIEYIIWRTTVRRFEKIIDSLCPEEALVLQEIYRRLRKFPEFNGSVAILFAQSEYAICKRNKIEQTAFENAFNSLIEKELVNMVYSSAEYKVVSLDRSLFVTNALYYKECGTDSDLCSEFDMNYDIDREQEAK